MVNRLADFFAWLGGWVLWLAASVSDWVFGKDRPDA